MALDIFSGLYLFLFYFFVSFVSFVFIFVQRAGLHMCHTKNDAAQVCPTTLNEACHYCGRR